MLDTAACVFLSDAAYITDLLKTNQCSYQCYCRNWNPYDWRAICRRRRTNYGWSKSHLILFVHVRVM